MLKKTILTLIKIYQRTLSFDHGWMKIIYPNGVCRFQPTCSEYVYRAIEKYGITKGVWMGLKRILRCNPWNKGGFDPLT